MDTSLSSLISAGSVDSGRRITPDSAAEVDVEELGTNVALLFISIFF